MFKKYLAIVSALVIALSLTSCSKGSESTDSKNDSNVFENAEEEEQYLFLPDGVSLDKDHEYDPEDGVWSDYKKKLIKYIEIFPDEDGYISYDPMGVKFALPEKCHAYLFPYTSVDAYLNFILITDEWFPNVNNYIMISTATVCDMGVRPYCDVKDLYPDILNYRGAMKTQVEKRIPLIEAGEEFQLYNFFDIPDNNLTEMSEEESDDDEEDIADMMFSPDNYIVNMGFGCPDHCYAPDSEISGMNSEITENGNRLDLKLEYSVKRYGIDMDKNVHWIVDAPSDEKKYITAKRVEFSCDVRTDIRFDEEGFLLKLKAYVPENCDGETFGNNNYHLVADNILGGNSPYKEDGTLK